MWKRPSWWFSPKPSLKLGLLCPSSPYWIGQFREWRPTSIWAFGILLLLYYLIIYYLLFKPHIDGLVKVIPRAGTDMGSKKPSRLQPPHPGMTFKVNFTYGILFESLIEALIENNAEIVAVLPHRSPVLLFYNLNLWLLHYMFIIWICSCNLSYMSCVCDCAAIRSHLQKRCLTSVRFPE